MTFLSQRLDELGARPRLVRLVGGHPADVDAADRHARRRSRPTSSESHAYAPTAATSRIATTKTSSYLKLACQGSVKSVRRRPDGLRRLLLRCKPSFRSRCNASSGQMPSGSRSAATPPVAGALAPHVRAPAQELLDLALVAIALLAGAAAQDRLQAQVLAELEHGLARGVAVAEAGRLVAGGCRPRGRSAAGWSSRRGSGSRAGAAAPPAAGRRPAAAPAAARRPTQRDRPPRAPARRRRRR